MFPNQMNNFNMMNMPMPMDQGNGVMGGMGPMMGNPQNGMGMNNPMGMGMNNQMMGMNVNNGMSNSMDNMQMNNQMMNQMGMMPGMNMMNPQMLNSMGQLGMNQMMMNQMGMMPGMMPMMKAPMTEEQKKQLRMQGYLMGKQMAEAKKKANAAKNPAPTPAVQEGPATGELNIKFNKGGSITNIKMDAESMVAELINEYFTKTGTQSGTFKFGANTLLPSDTSTLAEAGLKNNSEITVS